MTQPLHTLADVQHHLQGHPLHVPDHHRQGWHIKQVQPEGAPP